MDDKDDLIGDTSKGSAGAAAAKAPAKAKAKAAAKAPAKAKAKAPAKPAAKAKTPAKAPAKAKAKSSGERSARGEGKFYFAPEDRAKVQKLIAAKVKKPVSTKEFATANNLPTWQVRLAAVDLVNEKKLKLSKSGDKGGVLIMAPK